MDLVCVEDFERQAKRVLPLMASSYYFSGADEETTLRENVAAFRRINLKPRVLRDVSSRTTSTTLLGEQVDIPIGISPTAFHRLAWPDGEISTARAGDSRRTCFVVSVTTTTPLDEICSACPRSLKWFQLTLLVNRQNTAECARQAETLGYKAIVLLVDLPVIGKKRVNKRKPLNLPPHIKIALAETLSGKTSTGIVRAVDIDTKLSWKDITWLKTITSLPIVVKGVLTPEDAILAVEHGVSAVWVSNHGGRQLDTVPATIDALPDIVAAVGDKVEVYIDGGIRTGTDVLKALAMGARAVFVGRPILCGLACKGQAGVEQVLDILGEELGTAMALSGCADLQDINSSLVARSSSSML